VSWKRLDTIALVRTYVFKRIANKWVGQNYVSYKSEAFFALMKLSLRYKKQFSIEKVIL